MCEFSMREMRDGIKKCIPCIALLGFPATICVILRNPPYLRRAMQMILEPWMSVILLMSVGLWLSAFLGLYAVDIFSDPKKAQNEPERWHFYQTWFNFIGSLVGWVLISYLSFSVLAHRLVIKDIAIAQLLLFLIGLIGIAGWLPAVIAGVASSADTLAISFLEWLKKKLKG